MTESRPYQSPVDQLLRLEDITESKAEWPDYPALYGLTVADLPELMRLSLDEDPLGCENYEWMIHGLRAVAQLDPTVAIDLYLQQLHLFVGDDLLWEEADQVCRLVGEAAIEPCACFLQNTAEDEWSRRTVVGGLEEIAKSHPDCRAACVQVMVDQLRRYKLEENNVVNSSLVDSLTQLRAVEAAEAIEEAFANCELDEWLTGSWPSVQVKLGLKSESDFSAEELKPTPPPQVLAIRKSLDRITSMQEQLKEVQARSERKSKPQQKPISFPSQAALSPKKSGFGGSGVRSTRNKKKKR
jgi:Protein of unknown function (DUF1186)